MGLDWTLPRLPVSLPAKPVPYVNDLAVLKDRFAKALLNLNEHDFAPRAVWRDLFTLTGTSRTFYGPESIASAWKETSTSQSPFGFSFPESPVSGGQDNEPWLELPFAFQILGPPAITGSGSLSIVCNDEGQWQIWMLKTMAEQLTGQRNVDEKPSLQDVPPQGQTEYDCVILGGGQAGLGVAGRLHTLGVSYVVLDKNARVGDSWRNRYRSARLHTIREHAHLPFERTFDAANYPNEFLTKDQLAKGYEAWVARHHINVWSGAEIISASWNEETCWWQVRLQREDSMVPETIMSRYFIYAAGVGCKIPKMPSFDNRASFEGVVMHSNDYQDASAWSGKRAVIIGSANTAHDVAEDMLAANVASVCIVQRSPTLIVNTKHYSAITRKIYNENIDTAVADQKISTSPSAVSRLVMLRGLEGMQRDDPDNFEDYERAGFKVDRDSDLLHALLVRRGGHYMDVGGMDNIATGKVRVKYHPIPPKFSESGLVFQDGEILDANVVVMATGFENEMNPEFSRLFGPKMAAQLEQTEGIDEEGEIRGLYKPTSPFWVTGGALGQGRFFSRFIALQVKAKLLGTPFRVYNRTP